MVLGLVVGLLTFVLLSCLENPFTFCALCMRGMVCEGRVVIGCHHFVCASVVGECMRFVVDQYCRE